MQPTKFSLRALVAGLLVDVGATLLGSQAALLVVWISLAVAGRDVVAVQQELNASMTFAAILMFFGCSCTALGAYATARIAPMEKMRHALGMGFISVVYSLLQILVVPYDAEVQPLWFTGLGLLLCLPAALLGGYLGTIGGRPERLFRQLLRLAAYLTLALTIALLVLAFLPGLQR